jgi:hypothetical protein
MADDPEVIAAMRKLGGNTVKSTPEQFRAQIDQEIEQWKPLIKEIAEKEKKVKWQAGVRASTPALSNSARARARCSSRNHEALGKVLVAGRVASIPILVT